MKVCEDGESESGDVEVSAASTSSPFAPQVICSVQLCRTATMGRGLAGWPACRGTRVCMCLRETGNASVSRPNNYCLPAIAVASCCVPV